MFKRTVIGLFRVIRKTASRQLTGLEMVFDALTTHTLARTGIIAAIAGFEIIIFVTFHDKTP